MKRKEIVNKMLEELAIAEAKFPDGFHSGHEGWAVIKEELDEMFDAIRDNDIEHSKKEAIQVGAMAMRYVLEL